MKVFFFCSETTKHLTAPKAEGCLFLVLSGNEEQSQELWSKKRTLLGFLKCAASSHGPMVVIHVLLHCGFRVVIFPMLFLKCKHRRKAVKCKTNFYQQVLHLKHDLWVIFGCWCVMRPFEWTKKCGFNFEKKESKNGNVVYSSIKWWDS